MKKSKEWANDYMVSPVIRLHEIIEMAQNDALNQGRTELTDITHRNYEATKRRGLITEDTLIWEFCEKLDEEVHELKESYPTDWSELADITLVCFAMAEHYGIDLIEEMRKKTEYNESRED